MTTPQACHKKAYRTWSHASNDAKALRRDKNIPEQPYYCRRCQCFHVGANLKHGIRRH